MTTGLLLLTTDGDAIHRLTHPRYRITRSYVALVHGRPTADLMKAVLEPVVLDGRKVEPTGLRVRPGKHDRSIIDVVLTEGRNRVVRRWVEAMGAKVERLARLSYGPVRLGDLPVGEWRPLTEAEEESLYQAIGMGPGLKSEAAREARQGPQTGRPARKRAPAASPSRPAAEPRSSLAARGAAEPRSRRAAEPPSRPMRDRTSGSSARRKGPASPGESAERPVRPGKFRGRGGQPQKKDRMVDERPMTRREARTPKGRTGRPKGDRPPRSGRPW
jgi:pseudouridine synthase